MQRAALNFAHKRKLIYDYYRARLGRKRERRREENNAEKMAIHARQRVRDNYETHTRRNTSLESFGTCSAGSFFSFARERTCMRLSIAPNKKTMEFRGNA